MTDYRIIKVGDTQVISEASPYNPDVVAAKLTSDPIYNTFVSDNVEQTSGAIQLFYAFFAMTFIIVMFFIKSEYGMIAAVTYVVFEFIAVCCFMCDMYKSGLTFMFIPFMILTLF